MIYLPVGDGHELYVERTGDLAGPTVLFLHGGPGMGFSEKDRDFFDFETQNVIFFDQRGAGKSKFEGDVLAHNTTDELVGDMNKILDYFEIEAPVYLFGGSWGSTLALVFAIRYPEKVKGMVLRGVYLPCESKDDFLIGTEKAYLFPDYWEAILQKIPSGRKHDVCAFFLEQLTTTEGEVQRQWAYDFHFFEWVLAFLDPDLETIKKHLALSETLVDSAKVETYYIANKCFVPLNYILDNADKIANIPTHIVHGRYDAICPAYDAWQLHKALKESELQFPLAGHSSQDPALRVALTKVVSSFIK